MNRLRGGVPIPEYKRTTRVSDPALRGFVPALSIPTQNANQTINKIAATLNRAGTSARNPILSGLAGEIAFRLSDRDRLYSVFFFRDRQAPGPDMIDSVVSLGGNIFSLDVLYGDGNIVGGDPVVGAVQNFLRIVSKAGAAERTFWVKSYEQDVVVVAGQQALDASLNPVEIVAAIVDGSRDWLDLEIAFMDSWADEFQVLHKRNATDKERGNLKSYGGAAFVSFFQTGGAEGVGTEVKPVTKQFLPDQHTLSVQNTVGLKHVTVRFRSKANSAYFVDVPVLIRVVAPPEDTCTVPLADRCGEELVKKSTALESPLQSTPSVPGVQDVASPIGTVVSQDLMYLAIHANAAGASPTLVVERYGVVPSLPDVAGHIFQKLSSLEYKPLVDSASMPVAGPPYLGPKQYTVCFSKTVEKAAGVALFILYLKDGDHTSPPTPFPGPSARDTQFMPTGEAGGNDECFYP